ncbi:MAG: DNRLRE domain-containing protein, partial [Woeseiaceae bacterium]
MTGLANRRHSAVYSKKQNVPIRQQGYVLVTVIVAAFLLAAVAFMASHQSAISTNMAAADLEADEARYVAEAGVKHALWHVRQANCADYSNLTNEPFGDHSYSVTVTPTGGSPISLQSTGSHADGARQVFGRDGITVYDSSSPIAATLIPGPEGKDTYIEGDPGHTGHNKGNDNELRTSSLTGKEYRALLQFDLSGLPPTATIQSATLELYLNSATSADVVEAHRLLRDWTESGVTWDTYDGANSWATPGGDYDPGITASFLADSIGPKSLDITETAKAWVEGSLPNYGLILLSPPNSSGSTNKYHSTDKTDEPWPRLTLTYACECGAPCPGMIVGQNVILSTDSSALLGGLSFTDKDLAEYDRVSDTATLFFEGAPLGLAQDIDALHVLANGRIVLSAINTINLGGITAENEDLIDYDPVADTATMLFDGSALFTSGSTDISAVHVMDNGHLLLANEYAATLGGLSFQPEDLIEYNPDANTATMLLDGSTVGLSGWIDAVHRLDNGNLVLSTNDTDTLGGLTFDKDDLIEYDLISDSATLYMDGGMFAGDENIRSVHIGPGSGGDSGGGGNLLLVVDDDVSLTAQEAARRSLIDSWGYAVNIIDVDDSQSTFDTAVATNDVAYISDTITEAALGSKLTAATIGIVNESIDLNVALGFSGSSANSSRDEIDIIDNSHSITTGFALGLTTITNSLQRFTYFFTDTAPGQQVLAETNHLGPQYNPSFLTLESGAELWGGGTAAGRRVQLPWGDGSFDINALNADGLTLLRRSIEWAAGAIASGGPIAHWKLDDGTGLTAVDSVGGHDGTLLNMDPSTDWVSGHLEGALSFDGSNDYVDLTSDTELDDIFDGGATIMAWIELASWGNNGYGRIFDKSTSPSSTGDGWAIRVNKDNGGLNFGQGFTGGRGWWKFAESSINFDTWHHVALAYDASSPANDPVVYLDGSPVTVTRVDTPSGDIRSDASVNLHLGNHASSAATFF